MIGHVTIAPVAAPAISRPFALVAAGVALAAAVVALSHRSAIAIALSSARGADVEWLAVAGCAAAALWPAGTVSQLGSLRVTPPLGRLLAVQVAASFVNHLLPGGVGGMAVNLRFLRRHGVDARAGLAALGLNSLAGVVAHVGLLAVVAVAVPGHVGAATAALASPWHLLGRTLLVVVPVIAVIAAICLVRRRRVRRAEMSIRVRGRLREDAAALAAVLVDPARAAALWLGATATPLLHALVLYAVLQSENVPIGPITAGAVYLSVSGLAALVPAPGGLGAFDVLLTAGLVAVGVPAQSAVGATVVYRLITVWVPLIPAGCVLAVLLRRRII
jgi:uncharacterized protein (TIRG00374 family)